MSASIQWHVGTMRLWTAGKEGWAFDYVCSIIADERNPTSVILFATMEAPPIARLPEIGQALLDAGYKEVWWERRHRGRKHWTKHDLVRLMGKRKGARDGTNQDPMVEVAAGDDEPELGRGAGDEGAEAAGDGGADDSDVSNVD